MDEQPSRSTVPPRRELLVEQYTLAHQAAVEEKEAAGRFEDLAEKAGDRRDYKYATDSWERVCRATSNATRHRKAELEMRKQEYAMYNHLDDENTLLGLRLLIGYSERRLERLKDDSYKATIKGRIAWLKFKILQNEYDSKMMEHHIVSEDLRNRAKGHLNSSNGGGGWGSDSGWGGGRPNFHNRNEFGRKLGWLQDQIKQCNHIMDKNTHEIKQNEDEWERIREKGRQREPAWKKLDDEARRHWAGLPARDYAAEEREAQRRRDEEAHQAARYQQEQERQRQAAEAEQQARQMTDAEKQRQEQADAAAQWEEEYGNALEEDPDFMAAPTKQYSGLSLDDKDGGGEQASQSDWGIVQPDKVVSATSEQDQHKKATDSGSDHDASGSIEGDGGADIVIDYDDDIQLD